MKRLVKIVFFSALAVLIASCSEKKKHEDIIAPKVETPKLQAPVRMQEYNQTTDVKWLNKSYQVVVSRTPDDSLRMVKDETGQKFVDNRISPLTTRLGGTSTCPTIFSLNSLGTNRLAAHAVSKDNVRVGTARHSPPLRNGKGFWFCSTSKA